MSMIYSSDGSVVSQSRSYRVDTRQNFGYAESCYIVLETGFDTFSGSHDSVGNFSFSWGKTFVAGVNFVESVYGNGYLETDGDFGVEQSITFVLQRSE